MYEQMAGSLFDLPQKTPGFMYLAALRKGPLPRRFGKPLYSDFQYARHVTQQYNGTAPLSALIEKCLVSGMSEYNFLTGHMKILRGRDMEESLIILPYHCVSDVESVKVLEITALSDLIDCLIQSLQFECVCGPAASSPCFFTAAVCCQPSANDNLNLAAEEAFRQIDMNLTPGISSIHNYILGGEGHRNNSAPAGFYRNMPISSLKYARIRYLSSVCGIAALNDELRKIVLHLETEKCPQLTAESMIRHFFNSVSEGIACSSYPEPGYLEYIIEDAFGMASSYAALYEPLADILTVMLRDSITRICKIDTPQFFDSIRGYILDSLNEQISIQVVTKKFGISQSYIGRLFKKYEGVSFNEFLTSARIDYAKKLLRDESGYHIKDVAAMVGYQDPFYFSRIFRSVTGKSPSEFITASVV